MRKSGVDSHHAQESLLDSLHLPRSHTRFEGVVCPPVDSYSVSWDCVLVALPGSPAQCFFVHMPESIRDYVESIVTPPQLQQVTEMLFSLCPTAFEKQPHPHAGLGAGLLLLHVSRCREDIAWDSGL